MRSTTLTLAWIFILGVAVYDCSFAWQYREVFSSWEMNPLMLWMTRHVGLIAVFIFKFAGLSLAALLAWQCRLSRPSLSSRLTMFMVAVYAFLSVHYVVGHQQARAAENSVRAMVASK